MRRSSSSLSEYNAHTAGGANERMNESSTTWGAESILQGSYTCWPMDFQDFSRTLNQISMSKLKSRYKHKKLERALGRAHTFAYHKIGHWIMNMLALVA